MTYRTPDEMMAEAEVIVAGHVASVETRSDSSGIPALFVRSSNIGMREAEVETVAVFKGEIAPRFIFRYPTLLSGGVNLPILPILEEGGRYRFYLRRQGDAYVSAYHETLDSGIAVSALKEGKDAAVPPLLRVEAEALALERWLHYRPEEKEPQMVSRYRPFEVEPGWQVRFYRKEPFSYPDFTSEGALLVDEGRDVKGWIGAEKPQIALALSEGDIGKTVRLTCMGTLTYGRWGGAQSSITVLYGKITSLKPLELEAVCSEPEKYGALGTRFQIPQARLLSVQRLLLAPEASGD